MKRKEAALTLRDVLRRRGVLSATTADLEERARVAVRFGLLATAFAHQRTIDVYDVGHQRQRAQNARRTDKAA
jgi:hypothetical protein